MNAERIANVAAMLVALADLQHGRGIHSQGTNVMRWIVRLERAGLARRGSWVVERTEAGDALLRQMTELERTARG